MRQQGEVDSMWTLIRLTHKHPVYTVIGRNKTPKDTPNRGPISLYSDLDHWRQQMQW